ncbi:MAG: hypothetical protein WCR42_15005 [bacterium]
MTNYKPPLALATTIRRNAPTSTLSENSGRSGGYYGDEDEETTGYKSVILLIQKGLAEYGELMLEVVNLILAVQKGYRKKYAIVPAVFGQGADLIKSNRYFNMGYYTDRQSNQTIADILNKLTGEEKCDVPAIIPYFFPKTDNRSLYGGKTALDKNDLMVIVGIKGEVVFADELEIMLTDSFNSRILFVEIGDNSAEWLYQEFHPVSLSYFAGAGMNDEIYQILRNIARKKFELVEILGDIARNLTVEIASYNRRFYKELSELNYPSRDLQLKAREIVDNCIAADKSGESQQVNVCKAFGKWQSRMGGFRGVGQYLLDEYLPNADNARGTVLILTFAWDEVDFIDKYKAAFEDFTRQTGTICVILVTLRGISIQYLK